MNSITARLVVGVLALCVAVPMVSMAQEGFDSGVFFDNYIADRVEVGLRLSHFQFTDAQKITYDDAGNIIGGYTAGISTYSMDSEPEYLPLPYVMYKFTPYIGARLGWEMIKGTTLTLDKADPHTDGDLVGQGPTLELVGRYPNESRYTPFAAIGFVMWDMDFEEESSFYDNGRRIIDVEDTTGLLLSAGCSAQVYENWYVDGEISYMKASTDAEFLFNGRQSHSWEFTMDAIYYRLGVKYCF